ncbi:MAG: thermonuclease family protein [Bacteroidota bacterium]|nr:thermonuclease family protein [Bacteroidota bacterium]
MTIQKIKKYFLSVLFLTANIACANQVDSSLIIGNFKISKVIDADTFRFENLDKSTRLLGIDSEETFKTADAEQKTNEIALNWDVFYKSERGDNKFPVKADSPLGFEGWKWAEEFFKNVDYVRLEKEDDERTLDIFGRYLVYAITIMKDGSEINYNVECVRNGYSPYFNKYGNSKRFHNEFVQAQNYAMNNKLGVWDPAKKHYPDYDERLIWWNKRAEQLENYDEKYFSDENYFNMASDRDFKRLADYVGKEITVFGGIGQVLSDKTPNLLRIPHTKDEKFDIVVYPENLGLLTELDIENKKEYYIYIKGVLETYKDDYQIVLRDKEQLWME